MRSKSAVLVMLCLGLTVTTVSRAALFDDTEARKRILEVEIKANADHEAQQNAINELIKIQKALEKRVSGLELLVNSHGLLEMQNQVDALKQDIEQLHGDIEVATHALSQLQDKQKEVYGDLDTRLRRLETVAISNAAASGQNASGQNVNANSAEQAKAVDAAQVESKAIADAEAFNVSGKYKEAFDAFDAFLRTYANSKLLPEALYGLGFAQYGLKNYKSALTTQQKFMESYATHPLAPNALLNLANCQIQLGQVAAAKKSLKDLIAAYPASEAAPAAQKRLKLLEPLK